MSQNIIDNLKMYDRCLAREGVEFIECGPFDIIVKTANGESYLYDDLTHTTRRLPDDSSRMTEEEYKREFSFRLRTIMYRKGINQQMLSEMTGINQPMLSNYTNGKNIPSFYIIDKIAKALGVSTDEFRYLD